MIFNGIEKEYVTVLRGRERPPWPQGGANKIVRVPIKIDHNVIDGMFTDLQRKKEDMAKWLIHDDYKYLEFKDEPDRLYLAKIEYEMFLEEFPYWAESILTIECKGKYSHERTIIINTLTTKDVNGHLPTEWKTKTTFTSSQTGYELQFKEPNKTNLRDICKIKLNYNFIAGDVLEIDYSKRKITVNGVDRSNILVILQSNYMRLPIGQVEFTSSHKSDLFYNERYY